MKGEIELYNMSFLILKEELHFKLSVGIIITIIIITSMFCAFSLEL